MGQIDDREICTRFAKLTMVLENAAGVASEGQNEPLLQELGKDLIAELEVALATAEEHLRWLRQRLG